LNLVGFYDKLLKLHQSNKALWAGDYGGRIEILSPETEKNVLVFSREKDGNKVLVVINMSNKQQKTVLSNNLIAGKYTDLFAGKTAKLKAKVGLNLAPWEYKVYYK
jgi:glycosidase